jgi:4-diphosphocytidyl-2-C-methyl-D-erythritol kinase
MTLRQLTDLPAPAKLNLFLHITGRRPDGYHLLQSVFMLLDWCDLLHLERRDDGRISREDLGGDGVALPEQDLVVRAALALQRATGCTLGAHIVLDKRIPIEAGMGGGSSDAATCLLGLNRLWNLNLNLDALQTIGLGLGADVPFFLGGRHAWVEGIGERLQPIELPPARFLVLKPPSGASTPKIFQSPDLRRDTKHATVADFVASESGSEHMFEFGHNDLQPVASRLCPDIDVGLAWFKANGLSGRMTGSGSAIFARCSHDVDLSTLPTRWIARHCNNLVVHPLIGWRQQI